MMLDRKTILVADPDEGIRDLLLKTFSLEGHQVETAQNGMQALQILYRTQPDLVIIDSELPDIQPHVMVAVIKRDSPKLPLIVVSFNDSKKLEKEMWAKGVFYYTTKPFSIEIMKDVVRDAFKYTRKEVIMTNNELENFKGVTRSLMRDALKVMEEINETCGPREATCLLTSEDTRNLPRCGWAELIEKFYLLEHYLDYTKRFCEGKV